MRYHQLTSEERYALAHMRQVLQQRVPLHNGSSFLRSAANVDRDGLAFRILGNTA
jgi:hypothetical protein